MAQVGDKIFRLRDEDLSDFNALVERTGLKQQEIASRVISWFVHQDELAQAMILGQLTASDDLVELVLRRLSQRSMRPAGPKLAASKQKLSGA